MASTETSRNDSNTWCGISASGNARQHNGNVYNNNTNNYNLQRRRSDETLRENERNKVLLQAAAEGQTPRVQYLIYQLRVDLDFSDDRGLTALHHAAYSGFEDTVKVLIQAGANINAQSLDHGTPLHLAAVKARENIVVLLLRNRARTWPTSRFLGSVLHAAVHGGSIETVTALLKHDSQLVKESRTFLPRLLDATRNEFDDTPVATGLDETYQVWECTAFFLAAKNSNVDLIGVLIGFGASVNAAAHLWSTRSLSDIEPSAKYPRERQDCLLGDAFVHDRVLVARKLLDAGAHLVDITKGPDTLFKAVLRNDSPESLDLAIERNLVPEVFDCTQKILYAAVKRGSPKCVQYLLQKDDSWRNVAAQESEQRGLLAEAVRYRQMTVLEQLLKFDILLLDQQNHKGYTALMYAVLAGDKTFVHLLLARGASTSIRSKNGETALTMAVREGRNRIVEMIVDNADVEEISDLLVMSLLGLARSGDFSKYSMPIAALLDIACERHCQHLDFDNLCTALSAAKDPGNSKKQIQQLLEQRMLVRTTQGDSARDKDKVADSLAGSQTQDGRVIQGDRRAIVKYGYRKDHGGEINLSKGARIVDIAKLNDYRWTDYSNRDEGLNPMTSLELERDGAVSHNLARIEQKYDTHDESRISVGRVKRNANDADVGEGHELPGADNADSNKKCARTPVNVKSCVPPPVRALIEAAHAGDNDSLERLLDTDIEINVRDDRGRTAIMTAALAGREQSTEFLISKGADLDLLDNSGFSASGLALRGNCARTIGILYEKGAKLNCSVPDRFWDSHVPDIQDSLRLLAWSGALNLEGRFTVRALDLAVARNWSMVLSAMEFSNWQWNNGLVDKLLHKAVSLGHYDCMNKLCFRGANPNMEINGMTALELSITRGYFVGHLLGYRGDPNYVSPSTGPVLMRAIAQRSCYAVRQLLQHGADPASCFYGLTALQVARASQQPEIVEMLEERLQTGSKPAGATADEYQRNKESQRAEEEELQRHKELQRTRAKEERLQWDRKLQRDIEKGLSKSKKHKWSIRKSF